MKLFSIRLNPALVELYKDRAAKLQREGKDAKYQTLMRQDLEHLAAKKYDYNPALREKTA